MIRPTNARAQQPLGRGRARVPRRRRHRRRPPLLVIIITITVVLLPRSLSCRYSVSIVCAQSIPGHETSEAARVRVPEIDGFCASRSSRNHLADCTARAGVFRLVIAPGGEHFPSRFDRPRRLPAINVRPRGAVINNVFALREKTHYWLSTKRNGLRTKVVMIRAT